MLLLFLFVCCCFTDQILQMTNLWEPFIMEIAFFIDFGYIGNVVFVCCCCCCLFLFIYQREVQKSPEYHSKRCLFQLQEILLDRKGVGPETSLALRGWGGGAQRGRAGPTLSRGRGKCALQSGVQSRPRVLLQQGWNWGFNLHFLCGIKQLNLLELIFKL